MEKAGKVDRETLIDAARENAVNRIQDSVATVKSVEQMNNLMAFFQVEAIHILATMVYNDVKQSGETKEFSYKKYCEAFQGEVDMLFECQDQMEKTATPNIKRKDPVN